VLITHLFYRLELRTRSLIHAAEDVISPLQEKLAKALDLDALEIVSRVETEKAGEWKYSKVFRHLFFTTGAAFVLGLMYVGAGVMTTVNDTAGTALFSASVLHEVLKAGFGLFLVLLGYDMLLRAPTISDPAKAVRWSLVVLGDASMIVGIVLICFVVLHTA
jgi:hypothetical protein